MLYFKGFKRRNEDKYFQTRSSVTSYMSIIYEKTNRETQSLNLTVASCHGSFVLHNRFFDVF